jgi:hypothetical protein
MHKQAFLAFCQFLGVSGQAPPPASLAELLPRALRKPNGVLSIVSPMPCPVTARRSVGTSQQQAVDLQGNEPFEAAQDLPLPLPLSRPPYDLSISGRSPAQPIQRNAEERAVSLTVPEAVQSVGLASFCKGRNRRSTQKA